MKMHKKQITKENGRYLIYYTFSDQNEQKVHKGQEENREDADNISPAGGGN